MQDYFKEKIKQDLSETERINAQTAKIRKENAELKDIMNNFAKEVDDYLGK